MSGIVALFQRNGAPVDVALLHSMNEAQRFRGPDGERTWHEGPVGLGHTLHKATLEAEHEVSPTSLDGRLFITADARIDARDELCERLRGRGIHVRTDVPDPELLLHAYDAWGEDFLQHLLGDFSFALWDAPNRKLVCAVDQLGVKPLFYADRGELFVASNSLECVRQHPQVRTELNEIAVGDFLLFGCYQARDITIYEDIARIPPGHYLVVESRGLRLQRYFSLPEPAEVQFASDSEVIEQFQELLGRAVRDRLRTPRVAVYMSGGVDSPLVALTAKRELARAFGDYEIGAFTCVYDSLIPDDERYYTGLVGESLSIPIDFQALDQGGLFDWTDRILPPEPLSAGAWGGWLDQRSRIAAKFSSVLTGWDGDALLSSAVRLHWRKRLADRELGRLARDLWRYVRAERALPPLGIRTQLARLRHAPAALPSWLQKDFSQRTSLHQRWQSAKTPALPVSPRGPSLQSFGGGWWGKLFDFYDPSLARVALDARHPLADLRVIGFAFGLPAVPWCVNKRIFRECLRELPRAVRVRPKTPVWRSPIRERLRHRGIPASLNLRNKGLAPFIDLDAMDSELNGGCPEQASKALPAVGFGVWLSLSQQAREA